jgi:hypothetical protein
VEALRGQYPLRCLADTTRRQQGFLVVTPGCTWSKKQYSYAGLIESHPELVIHGEREALYCFAIYDPRSSDESLVVGLFVNNSDRIIENAGIIPLAR